MTSGYPRARRCYSTTAASSTPTNHSPTMSHRQFEILTSETAMPARGLCELTYSAFDSNSILGGALLIRAGQVVADTWLDVPELVGTISTYDYTPGVQDDWNMVVIDRQGNRTVSPGVRIQCAPGYNRAPQPDVHVTTTKVGIAEEVRLDATASRDPDGNASNLTVRWDLDGDGTFDTSPTTSKVHTTTVLAARHLSSGCGAHRRIRRFIRVRANRHPCRQTRRSVRSRRSVDFRRCDGDRELEWNSGAYGDRLDRALPCGCCEF